MGKVSFSIIVAIVGIISISIPPFFAKKCPSRGPSTAQQAGLDAHNKLRAKHKNTPPLVMDDTLNKAAQACAQRMIDKGESGHVCDRGDNGENYYSSGGTGGTVPSPESVAAKAAESWYSEIKDYSYADPEKNDYKKTGHFTQLVWKDTSKLGIGVASKKDGNKYRYVVIGRYNPAGNFEGEYGENVMPLK